MIPLSDGMAPRRFPVVTVALIAANVAVWLIYELPNLNASIEHASFYPCTVDGSCDGPEPAWISWVTSMFLHGSWDHILGNMLFLAVFGKNVEDRLGRLPYLLFYFAGGLAATVTQTAMTLLAGTAADAQTPNLGASGAIAAVLGAYFILFPGAQIRGLIGFWFLYQLFEANFGIFESSAHGGGVAFFAHVGGFVFGALVAKGLVSSGRLQDDPAPRRVWT